VANPPLKSPLPHATAEVNANRMPRKFVEATCPFYIMNKIIEEN
jgi:hypothetical protein